MKRTAILLLSLIFGLVSTSLGALTVIGDFEDSLDGWAALNDASITQGATGATTGSQALEVSTKGGWQQNAQLGGFQSYLPLLGEPGAKITADVTVVAEEITGGWFQVEMILNGDKVGWKGLGGQGVARDGASHTITWEPAEDLKDTIIAAEGNFSWGQLRLISNMDGGPEAKFYIDNIRIETADPPAEEEDPKSTDTVIGNWEEDIDHWVISESYNPLYSDVNGVTLDNFSLDLWSENRAGWNEFMSLNIFDANLVDALKTNTKFSIDVTTLVDNWPTPVTAWNEVAVVIDAAGSDENGTETWSIWQILVKGANWSQQRGDVTDTVVADYSAYLPQMNYLEDVSRCRFILISNCGDSEGEFWRYFDNCRLTGGNRVLNPSPADNAKDVHVDTDIGWRPGSASSSHHLYLGTDAEAVGKAEFDSDPNVLFVEVEGNSFKPDPKLEFSTEYFWRVDGVNETNPDSVWKGTVFSFETAAFVSVDDFEDYNDNSDDTAIWSVWKDGWLGEGQENPDNGAEIYTYVWMDEDQNVTGQSMALDYDNSGASVSTVYREWAEPQDWTLDGLNAYKLELSTLGSTSNKAGALFVIIEDVNGVSKKIVNEDTSIFENLDWITWQIPVDEAQRAGVDLTKVTKLTMGVDSIAGQDQAVGLLNIDDIRGLLPVSIVLDEKHLVITKGSTAPVIDGQWDAAWDGVEEIAMAIN